VVSVDVRGVSKSFGPVKAVDRVSFRVEDGKLFFLLGPSGCGKTTLLRLIAGFYQPDRGEIYLGDRLINDVPPNKRNIGMVFQNYALWPHMTVYDNIVYGLRIKGVPASQRVERAKEILRVVKMEEYAIRYPNQLSGGQQQRIALARALVVEPDVLLLDEPLSNLDAKLRLETRDEIRRIQRETKVTAIYVTHDQEEALSMADRIAIMNAGRIEQIGNPKEVHDRPATVFVAGFLGNPNIFKGKVLDEKLEGVITLEWEYGGKIYANRNGLKVVEGQTVVCAVRPENIAIYDSDPGLTRIYNHMEAEIQNLVYYGLMEQYSLRCHGGTVVKATIFNPTSHQRKVGDKVTMIFEPEDVLIYPA